MSNVIKKIAIVLGTIVAIFFVIGFSYPYLTKKSTEVSSAPSPKQNFGEKIINEIKKVAGDQTALVKNVIAPNVSQNSNITSTDTEVVATDTTEKKPEISNTFPVYFGVSKNNLVDVEKYPDGHTIYSMVRSLASNTQNTRNFDVTSFTSPDAGYYVYFIWPTSFEKDEKYSCKAITMKGKPTGTTDCFSSGLSNGLLFNTTDLVHRTLSKFEDENGKIISYELYRAHYFISPGSTVYYKTF